MVAACRSSALPSTPCPLLPQPADPGQAEDRGDPDLLGGTDPPEQPGGPGQRSALAAPGRPVGRPLPPVAGRPPGHPLVTPQRVPGSPSRWPGQLHPLTDRGARPQQGPFPWSVIAQDGRVSNPDHGQVPVGRCG